MNAPNLRRRPPLVSGIPIILDTLDFRAETPMNLQIEKPPKFMPFFHSTLWWECAHAKSVCRFLRADLSSVRVDIAFC